ncbi:MAG: tetratricopeptide repeat protein [Pyrinomonadaceae bacterium]
MRCLAIRLQTLLAFLLITCPTLAQRDRDTFTSSPALEISGRVLLADTGESGRNIQVRLERFSGGIVDQLTTDSVGRFRFMVPQRGYYTVVVNAPGFGPAQQQADLQVLFRAFLVFELVTDKSANRAGAAGVLSFIDVRVPSAARDEFARAGTALARKDFADAIPHLEKAVFIHPEFYEAQLLLGTTLMDLRRWEKAEAAIRRALQIKPDSAPALFSLGEVYWRQKRYEEAEKTLQEGLKLDDKSWHGYFTIGRLYWDKGEFAKAGPAIGKTLQLKPDFAEAHLLAGNILLRINQQQRALAEYQEYLRLEPKGEFAVQTRALVQKLSKTIVENKK